MKAIQVVPIYILIFVLLLAAGGVGGYALCRRHYEKMEITVQHDTLTIRDTIPIPEPSLQDSRTVGAIPVSVPVPKTDITPKTDADTVTIHDTLYITLPREQLHYSGDDYEAWVSGYKPVLDSLWVFPETKTIYVTEKITAKNKRWGVGIHAGYGVGLTSGKCGPYIGVGISYNLATF